MKNIVNIYERYESSNQQKVKINKKKKNWK